MAAFCSSCGKELSSGARFCPGCGTPVFNASGSTQGMGYLLRPRTGRKIAGVCAAFARAYGWDVLTVRIITVILALGVAPVSGFAYIAAWILIPEEPLIPYVPSYPADTQTAQSQTNPAQSTTIDGNITH